MPANNKGSGNLSCSFCGKNQKEVKKLMRSVQTPKSYKR